jgi:hypothetical protein
LDKLMAGIPPFLLARMGKPVTIKPYAGVSSNGKPVYDADVDLVALVDDTRRLIRDAQGNQVISETTIMVPLGTVCPLKSLVVLPSRTSTVLAVTEIDGGSFPVPSHIEVALQ